MREHRDRRPPVSDGDDLAALRRRVAELEFALRRSEIARRRLRDLTELAVATGGTSTRRGVSKVLAEEISGIVDSAWASVAYVDDAESIRFVHGSTMPEAVQREWQTAPLSVEVPVAAVLRGEIDECELVGLDEISAWPVLADVADDAQMRSLLVVPILCREGRPIAAVALGWPDAHRIPADERALLDELLEGAARSFERAARTEVHRSVARTLQRWLLPPDIEAGPGFDVATFYEPGDDDLAVGGDWYDVVRSDGTTTFVVGDVVGHDARAAAEMGQVRHVLASQAVGAVDLADVLGRTDRYFVTRAPDTMATALVFSIEVSSGRFEIASAGHLPPIVVAPDGRVVDLELKIGPPIGTGLGDHVATVSMLEPGSTVVAFTDGVVEHPPHTVDQGIERLAAVIGGLPAGADRTRLVGEAMKNLAHSEEMRRDDAAGLVVTLSS